MIQLVFAWVRHRSSSLFLKFYSKQRLDMDAIQKGWFSEINELWPGQCFSLQVKKVLHEERSDFQDIKLIDT